MPERFSSNAAGLTSEQVRQRIAAGAVNVQPEGLTPTVGKILRKNILTLFNLINITLAALIVAIGHPENALFFTVAVCNTALGVIQELRSKRTLDKLSILGKSTVTVMRDGTPVPLDQSEIVLDDVIYLTSGNQICADAVLLESDGLEVNEALLTGESDNIRKGAGDRVLSGSFVTAGRACARVTAVGGNSFATALTIEAKKIKSQSSQLMRSLKAIIRVLTVIIVPVGVLLYTTQLRSGGTHTEALLGAAAAMTGMIPQGLVMLTGVTMTVSAVNLARHKALVQSLPSIETLARADVLCLDKTGTITDGTMRFEQFILMEGFTEDEAKSAVADLMGALKDDNATANALRDAFGGKKTAQPSHTVPFSSARKWSGASFGARGSFVIGASAFVFPREPQPFAEAAEQLASQGYRVLCLAHSDQLLRDGALPPGLRCMCLLALSDTVRHNAPDTFRFFAGQGVTLKVISGDDPLTVSNIAGKAGIANAGKVLDMSKIPPGIDLTRLAEENTVFGRVTPAQKRELIRALKQNGHTTCMTGDGVNDVPAMKESDCSVAMVGGSEAARGASDFVLMSSDFSAMVNVLNEGRRVINNIERVAAVYLMQTILSTLLALIFIFLPFPFPYEPLQMTPVNSLTVGFPSFFLALRLNYRRPENRFIARVLENSLPAALTVFFNILVIQAAGVMFALPQSEIATMNVFLIGIAGFVLLWRIVKPLNVWMIVMLSALGTGFVLLFTVAGSFFTLESLFSRNVFFYLPLAVTAPRLFTAINKLIRKTSEWRRLYKKRGERT